MTGSSIDPGFTTEAMARIWSNAGRVTAMIRVEASLARAQAVCGVIEDAVAAEIGRVCSAFSVDADAVLGEGWEVGTPVGVLVDRLRATVDPATARAIHLGATSQDIVDTAAVVLIDESLGELADGLVGVGDELASRAETHRRTLTIGRTFRQHAVPTTFGMRCAQWLVSVSADLERVRTTRSRLPVQLGGPAGTGVGLGPDPSAVVEAFASELALVVPTLPWHADRTPISLAIEAARSVAVTSGKVASDLVDLAQTEVAEVAVRSGRSSAMAGKRNPIDAIRTLAAEQVCTALTAAGRPHSLDRAAGPWHAEWFFVPMVFQTAGAALEAVSRALTSLTVDTETMAGRVADHVDAETVVEATGVLVDRARTRWEEVRG